MKNILLIDVGTTKIKFALASQNEEIKTLDSFLIEKNKSQIKKIFSKLKKDFDLKNIIFVGICSVRPSLNATFKNIFKKHKIPFYFIEESPKDYIVQIHKNDQLGPDLLSINYSAYKENKNKHKIVVSLGTATTISLTTNNKFIGTIIMPGMLSSLFSLLYKAELIDQNKFQISKKTIGNSTIEAINIGSINGHLLAINSLIENITKTLDQKPALILTGGDSKIVKSFFKDFDYKENLVFKGIILILKEMNLI